MQQLVHRGGREVILQATDGVPQRPGRPEVPFDLAVGVRTVRIDARLDLLLHHGGIETGVGAGEITAGGRQSRRQYRVLGGDVIGDSGGRRDDDAGGQQRRRRLQCAAGLRRPVLRAGAVDEGEGQHRPRRVLRHLDEGLGALGPEQVEQVDVETSVGGGDVEVVDAGEPLARGVGVTAVSADLDAAVRGCRSHPVGDRIAFGVDRAEGAVDRPRELAGGLQRSQVRRLVEEGATHQQRDPLQQGLERSHQGGEPVDDRRRRRRADRHTHRCHGGYRAGPRRCRGYGFGAGEGARIRDGGSTLIADQGASVLLDPRLRGHLRAIDRRFSGRCLVVGGGHGRCASGLAAPGCAGWGVRTAHRSDGRRPRRGAGGPVRTRFSLSGRYS